MNYFGDTLVLLKDHIVKGLRPDISEIPKTTPTPLINAIERGWHANANVRPEFQDITVQLRKNIVYEDARLSELVSDILVAWVPQTTTSLSDRSYTCGQRQSKLLDTGIGTSTLKSVDQYRSVISGETKSAPNNYIVVKSGSNTSAATTTKSTIDSGLFSSTFQSNGAEIPPAKQNLGSIEPELATETTHLISAGSSQHDQPKSFCKTKWQKIVAFVVLFLVIGWVTGVLCWNFIFKPATGHVACAKLNGKCIKRNYDICYGKQSFGICTATGKSESCCVTTDTDRLNEDKWRYDDAKCRALGGNCQMKSNSCDGKYAPLICGGPTSRQCCLGKYRNSDIKCAKLGGYCVDWRYHECGAGYTKGLCGGDNNRRCCLYCDYLCYSAEKKYSSLPCDDPCKHRGGTCKNSTNFCNSDYLIGLCCGNNGRSCCPGY
uniref:uncharacterized protein LOC104266384 n=1 Tax=Ciona intestinalis TaxID=7719 RepID=UPI00089DC8C4|nr:uncharacterized protein LOC104266384 [Ciona intestinalis]|eukprot:XP_026693286.1 uncharacterized protein LOC104266384 [Ciona intestinalis]